MADIWDELGQIENQDELDTRAAQIKKDQEIQQRNIRNMNAKQVIEQRENMLKAKEAQKELDGDVWEVLPEQSKIEQMRKDRAESEAQKNFMTDMAVDMAFNEPGAIDLDKVMSLTGVPITSKRMMDIGRPKSATFGIMSDTDIDEDRFNSQQRNEIYENLYYNRINQEGSQDSTIPLYTGYAADGSTIEESQARDRMKAVQEADKQEDNLFKYVDFASQTEREIPYFELFKEFPQIYNLPYIKQFETQDTNNGTISPSVAKFLDGSGMVDLSDTTLSDFMENNPYLENETIESYRSRMKEKYNLSGNKVLKDNPYYGWKPEDVFQDFAQWLTTTSPDSKNYGDMSQDDITNDMYTRAEMPPEGQRDQFFLENYRLGGQAFRLDDKRDIIANYGKIAYEEWAAMVEDEDLAYEDFNPYRQKLSAGDNWYPYMTEDQHTLWEGVKKGFGHKYGTADDRMLNSVHRLVGLGTEKAGQLVGVMNSWSDYLEKAFEGEIRQEDFLGASAEWLQKTGFNIKTGQTMLPEGETFEGYNVLNDGQQSGFKNFVDSIPGLAIDLFLLKGMGSKVGAASLPIWVATHRGAEAIEKGRNEILDENTGEVIGQSLSTDSGDILLSTVKGGAEGYTYHLIFKGTSMIQSGAGRAMTGGTIFGGPAMYKALKDEYDNDPTTKGDFGEAYSNFLFGGVMSYFARGNKYTELAPWQAKLMRAFLKPQVGRGRFRIPLSESEKLAINAYTNGTVKEVPGYGKVKVFYDKKSGQAAFQSKDGDWFLFTKGGKPVKTSEPEFGEYFNRSILTEKGFQKWMESLSKKEVANIINGKVPGIPVTLKDKIVMKLMQRFNMPKNFEMVKWAAGKGRGGVKATSVPYKAQAPSGSNIVPTGTNQKATSSTTTTASPAAAAASSNISTKKNTSSTQTTSSLGNTNKTPDIQRITSSVISLQKTPSQKVYDDTVTQINEVKSELDAGYIFKNGKMVPISKGDAVKVRQRLIELEAEAKKAVTAANKRKTPLKTPEQIKFDNSVVNLKAPINPKTNKPYIAYNKPIKNVDAAIKRYEAVQKDRVALQAKRDGLPKTTKTYTNLDNKITQLNKYSDGLKNVINEGNPSYFKNKAAALAPKPTTTVAPKAAQTKGTPSRVDTELPNLINKRYGKNTKALNERLERDYGVDDVKALTKEQKTDLHSNLTVEEITREMGGLEAGMMGITPQNMKLLRRGIIDAGKFTYDNLPKSMQKQADKLGVTTENFKQQFRDWTKDPNKAPQKTKAFFKKVWKQFKNWWKKGKEGLKEYLKNPKIGMSVEMVGKDGKPLSIKDQAKAMRGGDKRGVVKSKAPFVKTRTAEGMNKRIPQSKRATGITTPNKTETGESFAITKSSGRGRKQTIPQPELDKMLVESLAEANTKGIPSSIKAPTTKEVETFTAGKNEDRFWYELSTDAFNNKVRLDNKSDKSKLHGLVSATSVNEKPFPNLVKAISTLSEHMQGSPINTSLIDPKPITDVLRGESFETPKIGNFQQTFDYIAGITGQKPLTVNDRQVAARYGIKPSDLATNASLYEAISLNEIKMAERLNKDLKPGEEPWTEYQLQAASWTNTRYDKGVSQIGDNYAQGMETLFNVLESNGIKLPKDPSTGQRYLDTETLLNPNVPKILSPAGYKYKKALKGNIEFATNNTIEGKLAQDNFSEIAKALGFTIDINQAKQLTKMQEAYIATYKRALRALGQQPKYKPSVLNRMIDAIVGKRFKLSRVTYDTGGWAGVVNQNITFPLAESQSTGRASLELNDIQTEGLLSILGKFAGQDAGGASRFKRLIGPDAWNKAESFQMFTPEKGISIQKEQMLLGAIKSKTGQSLGFNKQELPNGTLFSFHPDGKLPSPDKLEAAGLQIFDEGVNLIPTTYKSVLAVDKEYNTNIRRMKNAIAEELAIGVRDKLIDGTTKPPRVGLISTAIKGKKPIENYIKDIKARPRKLIEGARSRYKSRMDILDDAIKDYKVITKQLDKELGVLNKQMEGPLSKINGRKLNKYEEILSDGFEAGFMGFTPQNMKLLKQALIDTSTFLYRDLPKHLQKLGKTLGIGAKNFKKALDKFMHYFGPVTVGKRVIPKAYNKLKNFWKQVYSSMKTWWGSNKDRVVGDIQRVKDARRKNLSQKDLAYKTQKQLARAKVIEGSLIKSGRTTAKQLAVLKKELLGVSSLGDLNKKGKPTDPEADNKIAGYIRMLRRFENRNRGVDMSKLIPAADQYPTPTTRSPKEHLQIEMGNLAVRRTVLNHRTFELTDKGLIADADQRAPLGKIRQGAYARFVRNMGNTEDFADLIQQKTGAPVYDAYEDVRIAVGNTEGYIDQHMRPLIEIIKRATGQIDLDKAMPLSSRVKIHRAGKGDPDALADLTQLEQDLLNHIQGYYNDPVTQKIFKLNRFMNWYNKSGESNKGLPGVDKKDLLNLKAIYEAQGNAALIAALDDVKGLVIEKNYMPDFSEAIDYNNSSQMYNLNIGKQTLKPKDSNADMNKDAIKAFIRKVRADAKIFYMDEPITRLANIVNTGLPAEVSNDMLLSIDSMNRPLDTSSMAEMSSKWVGHVMKAALTLPSKWGRNLFQRLTLLPYTSGVNMPKMLGSMMRNTFFPKKIGGIPMPKGGKIDIYRPGRGSLNVTKSSDYMNAPSWKTNHFNSMVSANTSLADDFLMSTHMPIIDKLPFGMNKAFRGLIDTYKWTDASNRWAIFNPMVDDILKTLETASKTGKDFNSIKNKLYWNKVGDYESLKDILRPEIQMALNGDVAAQRYVALRIAEHMSGPAVNWRYNAMDRSIHEQSGTFGRGVFRATTYPVRLIAQVAKDAWKVYRGAYRGNMSEMWGGLKGVMGRLAIMWGIEKTLNYIYGSKPSGGGWGYDFISDVLGFEVGGLAFAGADWLYGTKPAVGKLGEAWSAYIDGDEKYGDELMARAAQMLAAHTDGVSKQTVVFYRFITWQMENALGVKKVSPLRDLVDVWLNEYDPEEIDRTTTQMVQHGFTGAGYDPEIEDDGKRWIDEFEKMPPLQLNPY